MAIPPEQIDTILTQASKYKRFQIDRQQLQEFLNLLYQLQPIDLWDYIKQSSQYIRVILGLLYALDKFGYVQVLDDGRLRLTKQGRALAKELSADKTVRVFRRVKPFYGFQLTPRFNEILTTIKTLYKQVIPQNRYDQAPLVPEAALYKAAYAIYRNDVAGKNVVCIGDDDLTSIVLALGGAPKKVLAVDIDKYLLETIEEYAEKHKLPIETHRQDLRKPIPKQLRGQFDTFITEPSDTVSGITLFVSRGVELLKKEPGMTGYCGISVTACPPEGLLEIQKNFTKMKLLIAEKLPKYSDYPPHRTELKHVEVPDCYDRFYPPQKVWYVSDLVRLKTTKTTRPMVGYYKGKLANYNEDASLFG